MGNTCFPQKENEEEEGEDYVNILSPQEEKWVAEQETMREKIVQCESEDFLNNLKYIGGVDISFPKNSDDKCHGCACLVVLSYPEMTIVYSKVELVHLNVPYISTFLAFREVPHIQRICRQLLEIQPEFYPQLLMVDGNGLLHPRKFGFACHLGVLLDIPTIGVAKKIFLVDDIQKDEEFHSKIDTLTQQGDTFDIVGKDSFVYGKALRSTKESKNPIFVSLGHRICLDTCVYLVRKCCKFRIPEPIRQADQISREYLRQFYDQHIENCSQIDLT